MPHPDDQHFWMLLNIFHCIFKFICGTKKQRPGNFKHFNSFWNFVFVFHEIITEIFILNFSSISTDAAKLNHISHKQKCGENYSHFNCNSKVNQNGKKKSDQQNEYVSFGPF